MTQKTIKKLLFFLLGMACLLLAYIGIIMPGFPATPFILLTGYFFIRSSERMYSWIVRQKIFAKILIPKEGNISLHKHLRWFTALQIAISTVVANIWFAKTLQAHFLISIAGLIACLLTFLIKIK